MSQEALTVERLNFLLERIDPDVSKAGEKVLRLRRRLNAYFQYNRCAFTDELADRALDILATRLSNTEVDSLEAYLMAIAQNLVKKDWEKQKRTPVPLERIHDRPAIADDPFRNVEQAQARHLRAGCLDHCMRGVSADARDLFLACHTGEKDERMQKRAECADRLGLSPVALRVRLHRTRVELEKCVTGCLRRKGGRDA